MPENGDHPSMVERINEKIHEYKKSSSSSSSSDSENEKVASHGFGSRKRKFFGRKKSVHAVLGGGKYADIVLWRNKQLSGGILAGVTVIWLLFECMNYHLLTFICHSLMLLLSISFLWSNAASFVNRSPPKFPEVFVPEDLFLTVAHAVRYQINEAFATFHYVANGKDLKKLLMVIFGLWIFSIIGSWFSFLTLFYIVFLFVYTAPLFYEKYEVQVDNVADKAMAEINKHYAVLDAKVLQKIPRGPFGDKKQH